MNDLSFARDWPLFLLPLPVLALLAWWWGIRVGERRAAAVSRSRNTRPPYLAALLLCLAALVAIVAVAQPRWGTIESRIPRHGADLVVVVDISRSMNARDVQPDRLEAAKATLNKTLDRLGGDRIGLVVFAGSSRTRFPLTTDFAAARQVIDTLQSGVLFVEGGSNASLGLQNAVELLSDDNNAGKVILLLTDGDDLGGDPVAGAQAVRASGATLLIAGVGTVEGANVPITDPVRKTEAALLDAAGNPIITKLNEPFLRALAAASGGRYLGSDLDIVPGAVDGSLRAMERSRIDERPTFIPVERYQYFAAAALVLLVLASFAERWLRFSWRPAGALAILTLLFTGCATGEYRANEAGIDALRAGDSALAIEKFLEVQVARPDDPEAALNLALAYAAADRNEEAIRSARRALDSPGTATRNRAYAAIGHYQFAAGRLPEALDAFRRALLESSTDDASRHDYEVVLRLLFPPEQQPTAVPTAPGAGSTATPPPDPTIGGTPGGGPGQASPVPATSTPGGSAPGQGTPTPGAGPGNPVSPDQLERQLRDIDSRIARMLEAAGETPTAEEAYQVLELLAERARIASLRDSFSGGGSPRDY